MLERHKSSLKIIVWRPEEQLNNLGVLHICVDRSFQSFRTKPATVPKSTGGRPIDCLLMYACSWSTLVSMDGVTAPSVGGSSIFFLLLDKSFFLVLFRLSFPHLLFFFMPNFCISNKSIKMSSPPAPQTNFCYQ